MPQGHMDIKLVGGTEVTVEHCINCHEVTHGYVTEDYGMASYLHGYHSGKAFADMGGTCLSCHDVDMRSGEIEMWDVVKYSRYRGVNDVASDAVDAQFAYESDHAERFGGHLLAQLGWRLHRLHGLRRL